MTVAVQKAEKNPALLLLLESMENEGELLDPEAWTAVLDSYAQAMQVAVALTDPDGRLTGICHNPQPVWSLARGARAEWEGCPFCLQAKNACTAAAEARRTGSLVLVHDLAGLAHLALPLYLGDRYVGTLLAGQVFDRYPEPGAVARAAKEFGLPAQRLWTAASNQIPVNRSTLHLYGSLLLTLGRAVLGQRYGAILKRRLTVSDAELENANRELERANAKLLVKVAELSKSNGEKSVLLQEVHHRVNNNLQVIASLLRLQAEGSGDDRVAEALRTSQLRIESMALIHAQLYDVTDLRQVDFAEYCARLAENLLLSYGVDRNRIALSLEMDALKLSVDQAIPAGLILGELITNAIKYAFPGQRKGSIWIKGGRRGDRIELALRDDGVGMSDAAQHIDSSRRSTSHGLHHGLHIVIVLCRQLRAKVEQTRGASERGPGVGFRISFADKGNVADARHMTA
jgi:two-component sensor histidine kinase/ligand-binding sensor protein